MRLRVGPSLNRGIEHSVKHANAQELANKSKMVTRDEGRDMDWADYHDVDTIYAWLDELEGEGGIRVQCQMAYCR